HEYAGALAARLSPKSRKEGRRFLDERRQPPPRPAFSKRQGIPRRAAEIAERLVTFHFRETRAKSRRRKESASWRLCGLARACPLSHGGSPSGRETDHGPPHMPRQVNSATIHIRLIVRKAIRLRSDHAAVDHTLVQIATGREDAA